MTISFAAQPGQLFNGIQFSTASTLVVPMMTQLAYKAQVAHRSFHENVPGAFRFIEYFGRRTFPGERIKTRWGVGIIDVGESKHSLSVMQVKGAHDDRLDYVARGFDSVYEHAKQPDRWSPSVELTYESRGRFAVQQSARMEFYADDDWIHVKSAGISTIVISAGIETIRALSKQYDIPLSGDRLAPNAMSKLARAAHGAMEPVGIDGSGGWNESQSLTKVATPSGSTPEVVLVKKDFAAIEITNTVVVGPFGMKKPYSMLVVDLVKAAAAMRPKTFPVEILK